MNGREEEGGGELVEGGVLRNRVMTDHESECKAVEGARSGIIHGMSPRPQLHKPHQRGEAGVDVSKVPQDCGLEPCCSARHTDVTLNACTVTYLHTCQRPLLDYVNMPVECTSGAPAAHTCNWCMWCRLNVSTCVVTRDD